MVVRVRVHRFNPRNSFFFFCCPQQKVRSCSLCALSLYIQQSCKSQVCSINTDHIPQSTDYGRTVRKSPSLHGRKSTPTPKFLGTAKAYFVCHIGPNFQISLIYAFIGCPQSVGSLYKVVFRYLYFSLQIAVPSDKSFSSVKSLDKICQKIAFL